MNHTSFPRRARQSVTAVILALTASLTLSGCVNPLQALLEGAAGQVVSGAAENALEQATGGNLKTSRGEIPHDFPSSIPLPNTSPITAARHADGDTVGWILHFDGLTNKDADALGEQLIARGFAEETRGGFGDALSLAVYSNGELTVSVSVLGDKKSQRLQMLVTNVKRG